jgi:hypothetical protein
MNNVENFYMLRNTYSCRLTRTVFVLTVTSQGKPNWWMRMRSNRSVPLKNTLDCGAIVSCVCKKIPSFYRAPCSSESSTQFKLGFLLTEKIIMAANWKQQMLRHSVIFLTETVSFPSKTTLQERKLPSLSRSKLFSSFEDSKQFCCLRMYIRSMYKYQTWWLDDYQSYFL